MRFTVGASVALLEHVPVLNPSTSSTFLWHTEGGEEIGLEIGSNRIDGSRWENVEGDWGQVQIRTATFNLLVVASAHLCA